MKIISKIIALSLLATLITCASEIQTKDTKHYTLMNTQELQVEVEKLSDLGELPFEMGLELIARWKDV